MCTFSKCFVQTVLFCHTYSCRSQSLPLQCTHNTLCVCVCVCGRVRVAQNGNGLPIECLIWRWHTMLTILLNHFLVILLPFIRNSLLSTSFMHFPLEFEIEYDAWYFNDTCFVPLHWIPVHTYSNSNITVCNISGWSMCLRLYVRNLPMITECLHFANWMCENLLCSFISLAYRVQGLNA